MKKFLSTLLAAILILFMAACSHDAKPEQVNPPGSNGPSKPTSTEPPVLVIDDRSGISMQANTGTYSWIYDNGDGTQIGVCADSAHPLEWQKFMEAMTTTEDSVEIRFAVSPQDYKVYRWSESYWGDVNAVSEYVETNGNVIDLKDGGYIYEVIAKWTGENLAAEGTVHYGFYVIKDKHTHASAEDPQTVDDPVTGYCGNTMTTIILDDNEYTFMGSDSVNLTDILINLKYDTMRVCRCTPDFTVQTEFGEPYGVNLSQGYARCEDGQADLTEEQIEKIREILDNQT